MASLAVKDRFLIKAWRIEKGWAVDRMTVDFLVVLENVLGANFAYFANLP